MSEIRLTNIRPLTEAEILERQKRLAQILPSRLVTPFAMDNATSEPLPKQHIVVRELMRKK